VSVGLYAVDARTIAEMIVWAGRKLQAFGPFGICGVTFDLATAVARASADSHLMRR